MKPDRDFIAIVMATCNGEVYLEEQLESLFSQTLQSFRIYVGDDASTDATWEILTRFKSRYPDRMILRKNSERMGLLKNFEHLLASTDAPYIAFCDQDDIWKTDKLEREMEAMQQLESGDLSVPCLIHSDLEMIDADGGCLADSFFRFKGYDLHDEKDTGQILGPSGVMGNTVFINAALRARALPFPEGIDVHDYWIGVVAELFGRRRTIRTPLVRYRIHEGNVSNSRYRLQKKMSLLSKTTWAKLLKGDFQLPYLETHRKDLMEYLLTFPLDAEDRKVVEAFHDYLCFEKNRLVLLFTLFRYSLVKRGLWFRLVLFARVLLTRRYRRA